MTIGQTANQLRVSRVTVKRYILKGILRAQKIPRKNPQYYFWNIKPEWLEDYLSKYNPNETL